MSLSNNDIDLISSIDDGFKFDLGYSINDIFSVEFSYFNIGDIESGITNFADFDTPELGFPMPVGYKANIDAFDLSLLARHKWGKFYLYGKIGWLFSEDERIIFSTGTASSRFANNRTDNNLSYGIGLGFDINNQFSINLDNSNSELSYGIKIQTTSLGVKFRF